MKYKIVPVKKDEPDFIPYTLTLTFETKEESDFFHDKIMGKLTRTHSHQFHAAIFTAGGGDFDNEYSPGEIDLPK